jgi:hypothetical protein
VIKLVKVGFNPLRMEEITSSSGMELPTAHS